MDVHEAVHAGDYRNSLGGSYMDMRMGLLIDMMMRMRMGIEADQGCWAWRCA